MAVQTTRALPAQFIEDLGQDYGKQLAALTQLPVQTGMFAPTVAAQDPLQTAAYQQATDPTTGLGAYQPFLTKAGTAADAAAGLTGTGAGTGVGSIATYMSPYQADVIDKTLAEFDIQAQKGLGQIGTAAVGAGAFGGGRHGIAEAEYQAASDRQRALLQQQMLQQGFQQAQAARQQDLANQMGIAGLQSKLGGGAQQLASQQISGLGTLGAGQQGYPSGQQTMTPSASPLQTALGTGIGLAGIYGGLTGKNPFGAIGQAVKSIF